MHWFVWAVSQSSQITFSPNVCQICGVCVSKKAYQKYSPILHSINLADLNHFILGKLLSFSFWLVFFLILLVFLFCNFWTFDLNKWNGTRMCCEFDFISFLLLLFCRRFSLFALHAAPALVFGSFSLSLLLHFKVSNAQNPKNIPPGPRAFYKFYMYIYVRFNFAAHFSNFLCFR